MVLPRWSLVAGAVVILAGVSCAKADTGPPSRPLTVLAAASLSGVFTELGSTFERMNPGVKVTFSFASSATLAAQINQGAPVDVFASADAANMERVRDNTFAAPTTFATNKLAIIVTKGNPKNIRSVADLARGDVVYVSSAPGVPVGVYAQQVLERAKVTVRPKSLEADVKAIAAKVILGEADAGIVYETDVRAAGNKADAVAIPDEVNVVASYPAAVMRTTNDAALASAFVAYLVSNQGRDVLASHGFGQP